MDVETSLQVYYFPESLKTRAVQVLKFQVVLNVTPRFVVFEKTLNERVILRIRAYKQQTTESMISQEQTELIISCDWAVCYYSIVCLFHYCDATIKLC